MDGGSQGNRTLEQRLREIEDRLDILNLIASHPPSADTGADYFTRAVYVEDGSMDLGGGKGASGNDAIAAIVTTPEHQAAIAGGFEPAHDDIAGWCQGEVRRRASVCRGRRQADEAVGRRRIGAGAATGQQER